MGGNEGSFKRSGYSQLQYLDGTILFGYYECEKGVEYATKVQAESKTVEKWNEYMKDVMIMPLDPETGAQPKLKKVFEL